MPHLGNITWASGAKSSRMLSPVEVTPPLSNALRYSSATDLRCSSVIVCVLTATAAPFARCPSRRRAGPPPPGAGGRPRGWGGGGRGGVKARGGGGGGPGAGGGVPLRVFEI